MIVQLLTGWLSHEPGAVLDLGSGQAQLLIQRGIATADVSTKDVPQAPRTRAATRVAQSQRQRQQQR